jgi:predicted O-methyltransferase YrrM
MNYLQELLNRTLIKNFDAGTNNFEHVLTFFSIALQIRAKNILELGVREGGSTFPFLVASKELGGHTTSIDINTPIFYCPDDLRPYWTFIQTDAITYLQSITEPNYDLIYVDDWHSALQVRTELEIID